MASCAVSRFICLTHDPKLSFKIFASLVKWQREMRDALTDITLKEAFPRLLHRLAEHKILTYRGNQTKILNRKRLERIARGSEKI